MTRLPERYVYLMLLLIISVLHGAVKMSCKMDPVAPGSVDITLRCSPSTPTGAEDNSLTKSINASPASVTSYSVENVVNTNEEVPIHRTDSKSADASSPTTNTDGLIPGDDSSNRISTETDTNNQTRTKNDSTIQNNSLARSSTSNTNDNSETATNSDFPPSEGLKPSMPMENHSMMSETTESQLLDANPAATTQNKQLIPDSYKSQLPNANPTAEATASDTSDAITVEAQPHDVYTATSLAALPKPIQLFALFSPFYFQ